MRVHERARLPVLPSPPIPSVPVSIGINFRRHFACLAFAAAILLISKQGSLPEWLYGSRFSSALYGALHATALALALKPARTLTSGLLFVVITAAVSANIPLMGLALAGRLNLAGVAPYFIAAYTMGAAIGAAAYWTLVRFFWIRNLAMRSLFQTIGMCVGATQLALAACAVASHRGRSSATVFGVLPVIFWWVAFSLSMWLFARGPANARLNGR